MRGIRRWHPRFGGATECLVLGVVLDEGVHRLVGGTDGFLQYIAERDEEPQPKGDEVYEV